MTCTAISECDSSPCSTNADCAYHLSNYICTCRAGYSGNGMTCTEINECDSSPCSTNADCADHVNRYSCTCRAGYSGNGITCTEINECDSGPCSTNADCADHVNRYSCTCRAGYTGNGMTCTEINECDSGPCSTNADCADHVNRYSCTCRAGYTGNGMTCTEINECDSSPCSTFADCADHVNRYSCTCRAGYSGNGMTCTECSYDCANVCDGTATLDCNSTCSGGDTGVTPKMEDACEVCDGDGTSCIAVTAVRPTLVRADQDQALAVTGTSLSSTSVQCVAKLTGSTTEHRVPITSRSNVTYIEVSIEAYALEAGEYTLYCRVTATAALGTSRGTFTVYEPSEVTGNPTCVITGPTSIDTCTDLLMNGVSSRGGGVYGLFYTWTISPNSSVTFTEPLDGYASWTGLVADTSYTVALRVCTIFDTCSTCQETVTKTSAYPPEVSIETVVDVSTAPANREFELFGLAWPSFCPGAPEETDLNYRWTFSNTPGLTINTDRQDDQVYQVRARDFPPGQTITVTLTVSLASNTSVSAARQLTIVVASSDLEVFIDGGEERTASVNSGLQVFDGSHTEDPDDPTATLVYSWSAAGSDSSGNSIGSCVEPGASTDGPRLSIDPSLFSAGTQCAVMLTVTAGAKTGSMNVTFDIVSGTSPVCFATNNRPKVRPGDRTLVVVTCTSSTAIRDAVWSSQTRGDVKALDLDAAIADQYTDALPDNIYMMFLVIGKDVIEGGNKYNLQATITDVNGGQTKTTVILNVIKGLSGGQLACPSSYTELSKISVTTRKVDGEGGLTYMLLVQTSPGQYMGLSQKQSTGDFSVIGPPAYNGAGNIFHVEVCVVGENGLCKTLSCVVPTVNAVSGTDAVVAEIKAEINRLKSQSRSMEAAVLLGTLYGKTAESSLAADLVSLVSDIATKRTLNDASASTFLDILTSVPPQAFTAAEFATLASQIGNVADYFINNDVKVPERYLARLNAWISEAKGAGASSTGIATVEAKADLAATSGIEYGNSATYDLTSSLLSIVNDIPGDDLKVKDGSNNDVKINFGESVRSKLGYKNVVIKVTSFKTTPPAVTQSSSRHSANH
ncbi:uncharacterized protein LOC124261620 [Haliotis rubra]|uniref:uncharacterized protein LOC124261620 n=1 Tax=Haliotis rubra TaxID=36100 RepID=UPI001EE5DFB8|nr:uncharacterized protein LOC124261620 [Haliotis rubra]